MGFGLRALVPALALAGGTWLGLGKPDAKTLISAGDRAIASVTGRGARPVVERPPPVDRPPASPEPPAMREPVKWPRLNPEASTEKAWLQAEGPAHAQNDGRRFLTLTFDDGPFPETTDTVLAALAKHKVRATFFMIARYLEGADRRAEDSRAAAKRIAAAGHIIGNHTADHLKLTSITRVRALAQIDEAEDIVEKVTGRRPIFFRPPFGLMDGWLEAAVAERNLDLTLWSISADDMKRGDADGIYDDLRARIEFQGGGIVLLHDMHWPSVRALQRLLKWITDRPWDPQNPSQRGYQIVDLPEYIRHTAESPQPFVSRQALDEHRRAAWGRKAPRAALLDTVL